MSRKKEKTIYYRDELNDEFSTAQITPKIIDSSYRYDRSAPAERALSAFLYRCIAVPAAFLYMKLKFGHRIVGRELIKPYRKKPLFVYGNHTQAGADPCVPTFIMHPSRPSIIVHPNNVSIPVIGGAMPYLGAIPLTSDAGASKNFIKCIEGRLAEGQSIFIYPEAHIWPYCTEIRNFRSDSFFYPVKYNTPVFCFTNTYQKRRLRKTPRMVTYVDGPFFQNTELPVRERRTELRDRVYNCMKKRAELSDAVVIKYVKEENIND